MEDWTIDAPLDISNESVLICCDWNLISIRQLLQAKFPQIDSLHSIVIECINIIL